AFFLTAISNIAEQTVMDPCGMREEPKIRKAEIPTIVEPIVTKLDIDDPHEQNEVTSESKPDPCAPEDEHKIDTLFYKICYFCFILGVNFYRNRSRRWRA
ncbi:hypothetical protein PENTCL1PPCAC_10271, partial [Pristionchus entomophagus]